MQFADYSPPPSPSPHHQEDALRKGMGRSLQWAIKGCLDEVQLLEACLHDLRFDRQVEYPRGAWLWEMIQASNASFRFQKPIFDALQDLADDKDAEQLCELAFHFGSQGDRRFRDRLYEIVSQKPFPDCRWLAEDQILALDGEAAMLFAARVRGTQLADREWDWDDLRFIDQAVERVGEGRVADALTSSSDVAVKRFLHEWRRNRKEAAGNTRSSHEARMRAITIDEIVAAAESENTRFGMYRGWGMFASTLDLESVLNRLSHSTEPRTIANYLAVFSNRPIPRIEPVVLAFAAHSDQTVRNRAYRALAQQSHPLVRELALAQIQSGVRDGSVVSLFIENYQPGDEDRLLDALEVPDDDCELHGLLMDIVELLEKNPQADGLRLAVTAYALTPCGSCRYDAARYLYRQGVAPSWLVEECRYDSVSDMRKLDEEPSQMTAHKC